jgi:hypothetical protein
MTDPGMLYKEDIFSIQFIKSVIEIDYETEFSIGSSI